MDMKHYFVAILFFSAAMIISCQQEDQSLVKAEPKITSGVINKTGLTDWVFERLIRKALEAFQRLMKKGDPARHVPKLDPLFTHLENLTYNNGFFDLIMESKDVTTTGLSDFSINKISASMFSLKADIDLSFKSIERKGNYNVKSALFDDVHVLYGDGKLDWGVSNLNAVLHLTLGLSYEKLYVKKVSVDFNLEQGSVNLDGLLDNSQLGETINHILTDGSANFINKNREKIQPRVNALAESTISHLVTGMTLSELITFLQALIDA